MPNDSAPANERIPVLATRAEKARISEAAAAQGISMGEYLRRAADAYDPEEDVAALEALLDQVHKSTARANDALDKALAEIEASEARIEAFVERAESTRRAEFAKKMGSLERRWNEALKGIPVSDDGN